jgi:hypothetical protein
VHQGVVLLRALCPPWQTGARIIAYSISWDAIYDLLCHRDYVPSLPLLHIPAVRAYSPVLESRNSLTDRTFSISIAGWRDKGGGRIDPMHLTGPLVRRGEEVNLLPQPVWQLVRRVSAFTMRDQNHRTADAHRRAWGEIRRLALAAKAQMDAFLSKLSSSRPNALISGYTSTQRTWGGVPSDRKVFC